MQNQPSPRRRTRLELVTSSREYQPNRSVQGARGSPDYPWPNGDHGLCQKKASAAFLSKDALGLRFVTEAQFPLQKAAPRISFCAVSKMGPMLLPHELAKCGDLGTVDTRPFQAPSVFSLKESKFGVGF